MRATCALFPPSDRTNELQSDVDDLIATSMLLRERKIRAACRRGDVPELHNPVASPITPTTATDLKNMEDLNEKEEYLRPDDVPRRRRKPGIRDERKRSDGYRTDDDTKPRRK